MDSLPIDFSERVLATLKCCNIRFGCRCPKPLFVARMWNQAADTRKIYFDFYVGPVDGRWKYGFFNRQNMEDLLTMAELMKLPTLRNVRVCWITLMKAIGNRNFVKYDVADLQKLLNFVSFLSDESRLFIEPASTFLGSPEGRAIVDWLEEKLFADVRILTLTPIFHRILENQPKSTEIYIWDIRESAQFLERRLMSGDLRRVEIYDHYEFPSTVLDQIVQNVLDDPDDYSKHKLDIRAYFDGAAAKKYKNQRIPRSGEQVPRVEILGQTPLTVRSLTVCLL